MRYEVTDEEMQALSLLRQGQQIEWLELEISKARQSALEYQEMSCATPRLRALGRVDELSEILKQMQPQP